MRYNHLLLIFCEGRYCVWKWKVTICGFEQLMIPNQERKGGCIVICIIAVSRAQKAGALWKVSKGQRFVGGRKHFVTKDVTIIEIEGWKIFWHLKWEQDYSTQRETEEQVECSGKVRKSVYNKHCRSETSPVSQACYWIDFYYWVNWKLIASAFYKQILSNLLCAVFKNNGACWKPSLLKPVDPVRRKSFTFCNLSFH